MITFLDGPANGVSLDLRRAPVALRVVRNVLTGTWDGLDQLDDVPKPEEKLLLYVLASEPTAGFIDYRDKRGRRAGHRFANARYRLFPDQPDDDAMRSKPAWDAWCELNRDRLLSFFEANKRAKESPC